MKKTAILLLLLGLVVSCNNESTDSVKEATPNQAVLPTFTYPDNQVISQKKLVTIYLTDIASDPNADGRIKHDLFMFDVNGNFGIDSTFFTVFVAAKNNNKPGIIIWESIPNSGISIDNITPVNDPYNIFDGPIEEPPFVLVLSKDLLDDLPDNGISAEYTIQYKIKGEDADINLDPYIIITPH